MSIEGRELLRECDECHQDYPARQWRRSRVVYRDGVTGWICPRGHEMRRCDSDYHEWHQSDDYEQVCVRCYVTRFHCLRHFDEIVLAQDITAGSPYARDGDDGREML